MLCKNLIIKGLVQGVGYRYWLRRRALSRGIKGYVKNLADGNVEAVLCGGEKEVQQTIRECFEGPLSAQVKNIDIKNVDFKPKDFSIIF
ncbi:MAG: acylphosphatase [Deltaproteobacteria bacterium]|nr:acylphosphatase [Deltaproteobacteria bacterium]